MRNVNAFLLPILVCSVILILFYGNYGIPMIQNSSKIAITNNNNYQTTDKSDIYKPEDRRTKIPVRSTSQNTFPTLQTELSTFKSIPVTSIGRIYIYAAHQQKGNDSLTLITVSNCTKEDKQKLELNIDTKWYKGQAIMTKMTYKCKFECGLIGYHIRIEKFPAENSALVPFPIIEHSGVQTKPTYSLTICISPMTWYVDWTGLIDFLEMWQQTGAQRTYLYWLAVSREVKLIMELYELDAEFVQMEGWPVLPDNNSEQLTVYGQLVSYHDCLPRQTDAQFTIFVDLDELLVMHDDKSFLDYLSAAPPTASVIHFQVFMAYVEPSIKNKTVVKPSEYSLSDLKSFPQAIKPHFKKYVARPSQVTSLDMHLVLSAENDTIQIDANTSVVYLTHVRKARIGSDIERRISTDLAAKVQRAQIKWNERKAQLHYKEQSANWPNDVFRIGNLVEQCNVKMYTFSKEVFGCWNFFRCRNFVPELEKYPFVYPAANWTTVKERKDIQKSMTPLL